jgi:hypothetical protein
MRIGRERRHDVLCIGYAMPGNGSQPSGDTQRVGDGDDMPPTGDEAHEQRKATSMPIVWLGFGLLLVAAFVAVLWMRFGVPHLAVNAAAPPQSAANPPAKLSR